MKTVRPGYYWVKNKDDEWHVLLFDSDGAIWYCGNEIDDTLARAQREFGPASKWVPVEYPE
jgi:hypothetical protein